MNAFRAIIRRRSVYPLSKVMKRLVHCPYQEAAEYLGSFIAQHRAPDGSSRIGLRLPISTFAEPRTLAERRLSAALYPLHSSRDPQQVYSVTWSPTTRGAFPEFSAALAFEQPARDDCFGMFVSGSFELFSVPMDASLDAALFRRIANASARDLLRTIADYVENACAHDFAARAGFGKPTKYSGFSIRSTDSRALML
jgi:hypothetical protein